MSAHKYKCIDSGSENCPCYLALTGDCLVCTRLQGKDYCDCSWSGVCIFNEYIQSGNRVNNPRKDFLAHILKKSSYLEDLIVLTLETGRGFALKACRPGSYIFLKTPSEKGYYNVPISVLSASPEAGAIQVAIKCISAKTKYIFEAENELLVRGIYRNGILGLQNLYGFGHNFDTCKKTLLITKGIGLAPGILLNQWLLQGNSQESADVIADNLYFLIDANKIPLSLPQHYLPGDWPNWLEMQSAVSDKLEVPKTAIAVPTGKASAEPQKINYISLADIFNNSPSNPGESDLLKYIRDNHFEAVVVLASDYYIEAIRRLLIRGRNLYGDSVPSLTAYSNNFRLCCGEGICGACSHISHTGNVYKMCKCAGDVGENYIDINCKL